MRLYSWRSLSRALFWIVLAVVLGFVVFKKIFFAQHVPEFLKSSLKEHSVLKPELYSLDSQGNPVKIEARFMQKKGDHDYFIAMPLAYLDKKNGLFLNAKSNAGVYMPKKSVLHLTGAVELWDQEKLRIETESVSVYFKEKKALGRQAVSGKGPMGHFQGTGFHAQEDQLVIHGPCEVSILEE